MACRSCPYQYPVVQKMFERIRMKRKEVDGKNCLVARPPPTNSVRTVQCPEDTCDGARAFFYQVQIRSADEPMTTFYKVRKVPRSVK